MKKRTYSKKDIKKLIQKIKSSYNFDLDITKKDKVEEVDDRFILINGVQNFFFYEKIIIPTLKILLQKKEMKEKIKKVVIDMGAIKFVANGADIMRPGITEMDNFEKNNIVLILDVEHKSPIAIGVALYSSEDILKRDSGKVIKTIHYIGDDIWND